MKPLVNPKRSLVRQLEVGFALIALIIVGGLALFMDAALRHSLEAEDDLVLKAQTASLVRSATEGRLEEGDPNPRPEKAEWRLVLAGRAPRQSPGMAGLPILPAGFPPADGRTHEWETEEGRTISALRTPLPHGELLLVMDRSHEASILRGFRRTLALGSLIAALAAALLGRAVARRGLRSVQAIANETATIRPGGPFHLLDPRPFPSEFEAVVDTLNGALSRLQGAIERLETLGSELAHELRTPLQHLRSSLEDLALGRRAVEPQALGPALEACDRLQALIEEILFLAHSEDPKASLRWQSVDAAAFLEETRAFFEGMAEEAQVSLSAASPEGLSLAADPALLQRALHNLVSNALRATPAQGAVRLEAGWDGEGPFLAVRDTGPGLPPGLRERVGTWWLRGPGRSGHGLGLAIVHSILKLHGGRLVLGDNEGGGTRASLHLPPREP